MLGEFPWVGPGALDSNDMIDVTEGGRGVCIGLIDGAVFVVDAWEGRTV